MSSITTHQQSGEYWKQHVLACADAGISKAQYCRDHELTYHCFIYWYAKFDNRHADKPSPATTVRSKLVPVSVAQQSHKSGLSLRLPNGASINGITDQSVSLVGRLIEQL